MEYQLHQQTTKPHQQQQYPTLCCYRPRSISLLCGSIVQIQACLWCVQLHCTRPFICLHVQHNATAQNNNALFTTCHLPIQPILSPATAEGHLASDTLAGTWLSTCLKPHCCCPYYYCCCWCLWWQLCCWMAYIPCLHASPSQTHHNTDHTGMHCIIHRCFWPYPLTGDMFKNNAFHVKQTPSSCHCQPQSNPSSVSLKRDTSGLQAADKSYAMPKASMALRMAQRVLSWPCGSM